MSVNYIAEITNTKEIILKGMADLSFWNEFLRREKLFPFNFNGFADVFIGTIESKFNGIKFRENVLSVSVSKQANGAVNDGYFLVQGFSTVRLFAFLERFFFKTPYSHARIELDFPISASLSSADDTFFKVKRSDEFSVSDVSKEMWEGTIFLPRQDNRKAEVFYAKIGGKTQTVPFDQSRDFLDVNENYSAFRCLKESNFQAKEWKIRDNATHARSKTFKRDSD